MCLFTFLSGHISPISKDNPDLSVNSSCQDYFFGCSSENFKKKTTIKTHTQIQCTLGGDEIGATPTVMSGIIVSTVSQLGKSCQKPSDCHSACGCV